MFGKKKSQEILPISLRIWSEFYANYYSKKTLRIDIVKKTILRFKTDLDKLEENIILQHQRYLDKKISFKTFIENHFNVYSKSLLISSAYTIGHCYAIEKKSLKKINFEIYQILQKHMFYETYLEIEKILVTMLNKYPEDWNEEIFHSLQINILNFYQNLGVCIDSNGEKYICVPNNKLSFYKKLMNFFKTFI